MKGALLDTSFLITLTNSGRPNHATAKRYYAELFRKQVPMFLSTIVISEFQVRQDIRDLGLQNFRVIPFNIDHARAAGSLADAAIKNRPAGYERVAIKDDIKLLAQCELEGVSHFLTEDERCAELLVTLKLLMGARALPVSICMKDPFSSSWFNESNQFEIPEEE